MLRQLTAVFFFLCSLAISNLSTQWSNNTDNRKITLCFCFFFSNCPHAKLANIWTWICSQELQKTKVRTASLSHWSVKVKGRMVQKSNFVCLKYNLFCAYLPINVFLRLQSPQIWLAPWMGCIFPTWTHHYSKLPCFGQFGGERPCCLSLDVNDMQRTFTTVTSAGMLTDFQRLSPEFHWPIWVVRVQELCCSRLVRHRIQSGFVCFLWLFLNAVRASMWV